MNAGGFVEAIDPLELGLAAVAIGAGRTRADQAVDPAVGLEILRTVGEPVAPGEPLARVHLRRPEDAALVLDRVLRAFTLAASPPAEKPLVLGRIDAHA
jgi:thymidine phosphorylase